MRRRVNPTLRVAWLLPTISAAALFACNKPKLDQDGDGFTELTGDCDDLDANVHPEAQEVCYNGIDDNCNGVEDEEGATSGRVWYVDLDGDAVHVALRADSNPRRDEQAIASSRRGPPVRAHVLPRPGEPHAG